MNEADEQVPNDKKPGSPPRVAARLASVLDCEIADNRAQTGQRLVALTLAEPDGRVEIVCFTLNDGRRLRRMLAAVEPPDEASPMQLPPPQPEPVVPSSWWIMRSEQAVKNCGHQAYLQGLKMYAPDLAAYIDKQIKSLKESIRRHCPSRPAGKSMERRLVSAFLVIADGARRHG
ncbi:MAG: hypothetical protein WBD40_04960 [Tepidisphaeraceae bacterium]